MSHISSVPMHWRLQAQKYRLEGTKCSGCNALFFPRKRECPSCGSKGKMEAFRFSGRGEIVSFTVIRVPPDGFDAPYVVAIVRLEEGKNISAQIAANPEDVEIGMKVRAVIRKIYEDGDDGIIQYGFKFVPMQAKK